MEDAATRYPLVMSKQKTSRWVRDIACHAEQGCKDKPGSVYGPLSHTLNKRRWAGILHAWQH
jgi:hypothetical protein